MTIISDLAAARAALDDAVTKLAAVVDGPVSGDASQVETASGLVKTLPRLQAEAKPVGHSTSSVTIGTGSKSFTLAAGHYLPEEGELRISSDADPGNFMAGALDTLVDNVVTVDVTSIGGAGTFSDWTIRPTGERGATGPQGLPGSVYVDTTDGLADTTDGNLFQVQGEGDTFARLYKNVSGVAVDQNLSLPSKGYIDTLSNTVESNKLEAENLYARLETAPHVVPLLVAVGLVWAALVVDPIGKPLSGLSLDNVEYTIDDAGDVVAVVPPAPLPTSVPLIAAASVVWDKLTVDSDGRPVSGLGLDGFYYGLSGSVLKASGGGIQNAISFGYSAVPSFRAWDSNTIGVTIVLGQSLATGLADVADGNPAQTDPEAQDYYQTISGTPLHPGYALMFDAAAGVGPWLRGRAINGLTDLCEVEDTTYAGRLESICSSYADVVLTEMEDRLGYKRQLLLAAVGESGYSLPQLTRGSDPWAEFIRLIEAARAEAARIGKTAVLMNIVLLHGESSHSHGIEPCWYARELSRVLDDAQAEARYRLGQIEPVRMIVAPPARGYRSGTLRVSPVQLGMQLAAATDHRIVVGSPNYAAPHGAGGGHPNPRGYRRIGYALGDAAVGHVHADGWTPLMPDEWWWVSSTVLRIKYRMPGPRLAMSGSDVVIGARSTLVIDTSGDLVSVPSGNGRGYRAVDASGEITIDSVALVGGTTDQIDVTLATAPGANFRLLYAARGDAGASDDGGGAEVGARGVIRCDLSRTITDDSVPVYHWAIPHEIR